MKDKVWLIIGKIILIRGKKNCFTISIHITFFYYFHLQHKHVSITFKKLVDASKD